MTRTTFCSRKHTKVDRFISRPMRRFSQICMWKLSQRKISGRYSCFGQFDFN